MPNWLGKSKTLDLVSPGSPGKPAVPGVAYKPAWSKTIHGYTIRVFALKKTETDTDPNLQLKQTYSPTALSSATDKTSGSLGIELVQYRNAYSVESGTYLERINPGDIDWKPLTGRWMYATVDTVTTINHPAIAPVKPIPATPPSPAQWKQNYHIGWNAGAQSLGVYVGNLAYSFTVPFSTAGVQTGLSNPTHNIGYSGTEIDYAWSVSQGEAKVVERGIFKTNSFPVTDATVFKIDRTAGVVTYLLDDVLKYTSLDASTSFNVIVDCSLYMGGDSIMNAAITGGTTPIGSPVAVTGNCAGMVRPPTGSASNQGAFTSRCAGSAAQPWGHASSIGEFIPDVSLCYGSSAPPMGSASGIMGMVGNCAGSAKPIKGYGSNIPSVSGYCAGSAAPPNGLATGGPYPPANFALIIPLPQLSATGLAAAPNLALSLPVPVLAITEAPSLHLTLPVPILHGTGTVRHAAANLALTIPLPRLHMSEPVTGPFAAGVVTWAVNLDTGAVTRYTNYGFTAFGFDPAIGYIGLAADGLYVLGQALTDDGDPIASRLETEKTTFADEHKKRLLAARVNASGADTVLVVETETDIESFPARDPCTGEMTSRRFFTAKGQIGNNWRFAVVNESEPVEAHSLTLQPIVLSRH